MPSPPDIFPERPGVWWAALDDGEKITEIVMVEIFHYEGLSSFDEGLSYRFIDGSKRSGTVDGDIRRPIIRPSWDIVLGIRTRATVDEVRLTWLREVERPELPMVVGQSIED